MTQAAMKASGSYKVNFQIRQMIWSWDMSQMTDLVYHVIQLNYHPTTKKNAYRIFFQKRNKRDFGLVRLYQMISLLNCIGKVV